jgi:uncharacterized protein YbjT (DUF2867 family)
MIQRILVLGGTGHIGAYVIDLALARGHRITAFVRSPQKVTRTDPALSVIQGDPLSSGALAGALVGHDAILSCIGPAGREALRPEHADGGVRGEYRCRDDHGVREAAPHRFGGVTLPPIADSASVSFDG